MYLMNNNPCIQYIMRYINQQFKSLSSTSPGDHQTPAAVVAVARRRPCCGGLLSPICNIYISYL